MASKIHRYAVSPKDRYLMSLQIKYKGPAPDGSRASFIGDPKEITGTIGIPLCKAALLEGCTLTLF